MQGLPHTPRSPTGHVWARLSDAACLARPGIRSSVVWAGIMATNGWRMPRGRVERPRTAEQSHPFSHLVSASVVMEAKKAAGRVLSVAIVMLEPKRERLLRGGPIRSSEADLLFSPDLCAARTRNMISAAVPVVGGIMLTRAMADGFFEIVPLSLDPDDPSHDVRIGGARIPVARFMQCRADGFAEPTTEAPLVDLARLDLYRMCIGRKPGAAASLLAECLLGPVNDLLGRPFEGMTSMPEIAGPAPIFIRDAILVANMLGAEVKRLVWTPPRSHLGHPRLLSIDATTPRGALIVAALFQASSQPVDPETVADDMTTEPAWPWNPRRAPRRAVDVAGEAASHDLLEAGHRIAAAWHAARKSPDDAWRFHDLDGNPLPADLIGELDCALPAPDRSGP